MFDYTVKHMPVISMSHSSSENIQTNKKLNMINANVNICSNPPATLSTLVTSVSGHRSGTAGLIENIEIHEKQSLSNLCTGMFSVTIINCYVSIVIGKNDLITEFK
jgi:ribosomal protein S4E